MRIHCILDTIVIQKDKIQKHLEKLNPSKSMGVDGLHPKFLKETADEISDPIFKLCKISLEQSKIPDTWKHSNVTAIYKKGQKDLPSNYRPIRLTSIVCKIIETFIRDSIVQHMETNSLFTKHQYGLRKGSSCVTQLIDVIDNWTKSLDDRNDLDVIYFDFQKAFDTVPHERLLTKLHAYGIRGKVLLWIRDFLNERKQRVVLNGEESNWLDVTSGIPQGSVLGPILFLVYINDLPEVVHNAVKLFADDTKLYGKSCTDEDQRSIQEDINSLIQWSDSWLLKFNISKCKHMHLGTRNTQTVYKMDGMDIEQTTCEKDVGVYIDNELKFQRHIAESIKKANQKLGIIKRNFSHLDKDSFLSLYKSLVRPHLEYCSCVWSVIYKKDAISIENTQRRATKLVHHIQHLPYSDRLQYLGLPSLEYRRIRTDVIQLYKIVNNID